MELRTFAAGTAALFLQPRDPGGADQAGAATLRQLRVALGDEIGALVDGWAADGPDGEQILCLADLLHERGRRDEGFGRQLAVTALTPAAAAALRGLAARCRRHGSWGTAGWCDDRGADLSRMLDRAGSESVHAATAPVRDSDGGITHQVTRRLAELEADQNAGPGGAEALDEDAAFDLVSTVLRGTEHGDVALARWEQAAGALVDGARLA